jgi:hypothetical protein
MRVRAKRDAAAKRASLPNAFQAPVQICDPAAQQAVAQPNGEALSVINPIEAFKNDQHVPLPRRPWGCTDALRTGWDQHGWWYAGGRHDGCPIPISHRHDSAGHVSFSSVNAICALLVGLQQDNTTTAPDSFDPDDPSCPLPVCEPSSSCFEEPTPDHPWSSSSFLCDAEVKEDDEEDAEGEADGDEGYDLEIEEGSSSEGVEADLLDFSNPDFQD